MSDGIRRESGGAGDFGDVSVHAYETGQSATRTKAGYYRLQSERRWVVAGPWEALATIANALPESKRKWAGRNALVLNLVNSVGFVELPRLGIVELATHKFGESEFDAMLRDLTESATSLPFAAGNAAGARYSLSTAPRDEILYHAFVYLRYILSDKAPEEARLLPALELIVNEPHRLWRTKRRDVRIEALTRVDAHTPLDLVTGPGTAVLPSSLSLPASRLAERLGGRLPEVVSERRIRPTTDTPENRFVKAFIGHARAIIGRMRSALGTRPGAFRRSVLHDCDRMDASLMPLARHNMWENVGRMTRIPFASTVLQRRRGYRRVLQHFLRIRQAPMIPVDDKAMRDLLELKDIALLYELWTFFRLVREVEAVLKSPPVRSASPASHRFGTDLAAGGVVEWDSGVRLVYNPRFSRSRTGQRHSWSVPLRPDIALTVPDGPNPGLHLFDAKFRVHGLADAGLAGSEPDSDDEKSGERAGTFKRGDIYKMHAYRDAIPDALSVWILYPGGDFRFFCVPGDGVNPGRKTVRSPEGLPGRLRGVGAIPLVPVNGNEAKGDSPKAGEVEGALRRALAILLGGGEVAASSTGDIS